MVHVLGQAVEAEGLGDAVHAPGLGHGLEGADQELAGVLLVVGAFVGDAQHRQVARHLGQRLGDDVEVLGRVQRHRDAHRGGELARPHAGGEDDGRGRDGSLVGHHADRPALLDQDALDLDALDDPGAALARTLGEGLRGVDRVGLPILGQEHAAHSVADLEQRVAGLDLGRPDHLDREPEVLRHRGAALELLEPLGVERQADRAVLLEPGRLPGLGLQRVQELGGVLGELGHPPRRAQLPDQAGGVPGRAAGELPALQQQHVGDAEPGQVISDRAADDAAADDDDVDAGGEWWGHALNSVMGTVRAMQVAARRRPLAATAHPTPWRRPPASRTPAPRR